MPANGGANYILSGTVDPRNENKQAAAKKPALRLLQWRHPARNT